MSTTILRYHCPSAPLDPAGSARHPAAGGGHTELSVFTKDLLVLGYLSAVSRELLERRIAESRLRLGPPTEAVLSGALELEPLPSAREVREVTARPRRAEWNARDGWSVLLGGVDAGAPRSRRFLAGPVIVPPESLATFVERLDTGQEAGVTVRPHHERPLAGADGDGTGLAVYAVPEVRRWLADRAAERNPLGRDPSLE